MDNLSQVLDLDDHGICLICVNQVIRDISIITINDLNSYNIDINLSKHVVKKFVHSRLVHQLCEKTIKYNTKNKVVLYYNCEDNEYGWFDCFFDKNVMVKFFKSAMVTYTKMLPLCIFTGKLSLLYIESELKHNNDEIKILVNKIQLLAKNKQSKYGWFKKAKQFAEKYELNFLSKDYFTTVKSKQILYK